MRPACKDCRACQHCTRFSICAVYVYSCLPSRLGAASCSRRHSYVPASSMCVCRWHRRALGMLKRLLPLLTLDLKHCGLHHGSNGLGSYLRLLDDACCTRTANSPLRIVFGGQVWDRASVDLLSIGVQMAATYSQTQMVSSTCSLQCQDLSCVQHVIWPRMAASALT